MRLSYQNEDMIIYGPICTILVPVLEVEMKGIC